MTNRDMCFDLLLAFFCRSFDEHNLAGMTGAHLALVAITGGSR